MSLDYSKYIEYLKKELSISDDEIYDFSGSPGEKEFIENLEFCQEALIKHQKFGISPSYFFYRKYQNIDARAKKKNNNYVISINKGLIEFFYRCFVPYFSLNEFDKLNKYIDLEKKLQEPIGETMYKVLIHFTFYHELGHLIQFVDKNDIELDESLNKNSSYSIESHSNELDADLFSSLCVSTHIYQYFEHYFQGEPNEETMTNYVSILTSPIFIYFLSFPEYGESFYLKEKSHHHPLVRIISVINGIIGYFEHVLNLKGFNVKIDQKKVIRETFRISEIFTNKFINEPEFKGFMTLLTDNFKEIKKYYDELVSIVLANPCSAINRRNEMINKEKSI